MKKQITAVEWLENVSSMYISFNHKEDIISFEKIIQEAKEMEKEQRYNEEDVENLIKITYEETMRGMVEWFIKNKDKNPQEAESAIENYIYPRLKEKGINFKKE